jgi:phosphatidylglycerophosphate synthase
VVATGTGLAANLAVLVGLLAALTTTVGLGPAGWVAGLACGLGVGAAVVRGLAWGRAEALGPGDVVTLARVTLTCGVAALVAESFVRESVGSTLVVALAVTALLLDAVDGPVARRTGSTSVFGARFDGEADAFFMLVLSVYVARSVGAWVLVIGVLRYAFAVAGWAVPWLQDQLPDRYWRKVVAAVQGIVLTVAASGVAPEATYVALVVALALLVESFGRDMLWLWLHRFGEPIDVTGTPAAFRLRPP